MPGLAPSYVSLLIFRYYYCNNSTSGWEKITRVYTNTHVQGLTQTFMSSGLQDHQLRKSGGPTIFLVILTTTRPNVTILVNVEPNFFTLAMCFHFVNFVKPQKAWQETAQGWWLMSRSIIHNPHDYEHVFCSLKRVREGRPTMFLVLSPSNDDDCLYFLGRLRFWLGLDILVVHTTTGYECSEGPTSFLVVSDHRTTVSCERWRVVHHIWY